MIILNRLTFQGYKGPGVPHEPTFEYNKQNVGDYIEADFIEELGVIDHANGPGGTRTPVYGFKLLVTLSANHREPYEVIFTCVTAKLSCLFWGRTPGEKLVIRPKQVMIRGLERYALVVNNEIGSDDGYRVKL